MASGESVVGRGDPIEEVERKECEEIHPPYNLEGLEALDLVSPIRKEGSLNANDACVLGHHFRTDCTSETSSVSTTLGEDTLSLKSASHNSSVQDTILTLGHSGSTTPSLSMGLNGPSYSVNANVTLPFGSSFEAGSTNDSASQMVTLAIGPSFQGGSDKDYQQHKLSSLQSEVNLSSMGSSSSLEFNPFYSFKNLGQVKTLDALECGSTTGVMEKTRDPLRMCREIKQKGSLSSSCEGIPVPRPRGRPRKREEGEPRKKAKFSNREVKKFNRVSDSSGLLSGLNPGIINHVRNSKQVHSIIEATVRSHRLDAHIQTNASDQIGKVSKRMAEKRKEQHFILSRAGRHDPHGGTSTSLCIGKEQGDYTPDLNYSSANNMVSENAINASTNEPSRNQDCINSQTLKAAFVASQWFQLLQQDIKGRLAALRRSRTRIRNVIQTELPYLSTTEFRPYPENDPSVMLSADIVGTRKSISDSHVRHWESIFTKMEKALCEEGKHLESWLKQVQQMHSLCEYGLKSFNSDGLPRLFPPDASRKPSEAPERELAVRAAAASIYSTCNFIMTNR